MDLWEQLVEIFAVMIRVNVILWRRRGGQIHSVELIRGLLEDLGSAVRVCATSEEQANESYRADVNIFSCEIHRDWLPLARRNVLIPNQEQDALQSFLPPWQERRGPKEDPLDWLRRLDRIWVKTRHAEEIYGRLGLPVAYIGFTSKDRMVAEIEKEEACWLCVVGDNFDNKNLRLVLRIWERHADFPRLTVVLRDPPFDLPQLPHVRYQLGFLPEDRLSELQSKSLVHVCPSVMEGWGHYIVEAMSTAGLVITADAPPMNEHINENRGALYKTAPGIPLAFGFIYQPDDKSLEETVRRVMALSRQEKLERGRRAREHFLFGDASFRENFFREWNSLRESLWREALAEN